MRFVFQSILIFLSALVTVQATYACSCLHRSFEEQFDQTEFIFVGKVLSITEDIELKRMPYESKRYLVKMEVLKSFKGVKAAEITVTQYEVLKSTSCPHLTLEQDEKYLIYAFSSSYVGREKQVIKDTLAKSACSPSGRFDANDPTYKKLLEYDPKPSKRTRKTGRNAE